jgi:hypothetical protein
MSVEALPLNGMANSNADIAAHLREQAQWVEQGAWDDLRNVYLVFERIDGRIERATCGQPCDLARAVGVLYMAAVQAST